MAVFGPNAGAISSTSICRGGLVEQTYDALRAWDDDATKQANLDVLRSNPTISAVSQSWRNDIVLALSRRFDPAGRDAALVQLARRGCSFHVWRPILLWHLTRNEFLVRYFLIEFLFQKHREGYPRLTADDVVPFLQQKAIQKRLKNPWRPPTLRRVANGLLQTAGDFELLSGTTVKSFSSYHMPEESFVYILHAMADTEPSARRIVDAADWHMYLMDASDVEREILRLHQFRKVHYEVAGSLAQLKLPFGSAVEYTRELCT